MSKLISASITWPRIFLVGLITGIISTVLVDFCITHTFKFHWPFNWPITVEDKLVLAPTTNIGPADNEKPLGYEIGDWVKVTNIARAYTGKVGVVTEYEGRSVRSYTVRFYEKRPGALLAQNVDYEVKDLALVHRGDIWLGLPQVDDQVLIVNDNRVASGRTGKIVSTNADDLYSIAFNDGSIYTYGLMDFIIVCRPSKTVIK